MTATLRPIGHLKGMVNDQTEITVPSGISIREALALIKVPSELVALVVVNGVHTTDKGTILNDGDVVKLMAVIGGG
jgi:sulfur carrier protein ThiS